MPCIVPKETGRKVESQLGGMQDLESVGCMMYLFFCARGVDQPPAHFLPFSAVLFLAMKQQQPAAYMLSCRLLLPELLWFYVKGSNLTQSELLLESNAEVRLNGTS
jgi:hypothetical protein